MKKKLQAFIIGSHLEPFPPPLKQVHKNAVCCMCRSPRRFRKSLVRKENVAFCYVAQKCLLDQKGLEVGGRKNGFP